MIIDPDEEGPVHREPCLECGEETAIGSSRFSDRRVVDVPAVHGYLCGDCLGRIRQRGHFEGLSDERMVEVWSVMLTGGWL